jgi:hypothetical protein
LDFAHYLIYKIIKLNVSKAGFCFFLQVEKRKEDKAYLIPPRALPGLRLVQPDNPASRLSVLLPFST